MKIVIIGCGKVGLHLTQNLSREGHDCVVIDRKASLVNEVINRYNVMGFVGNGASVELQREAACDNADLVIAVTDLDELNILCSIIAKQLGAKYTVVRVRNNDYSQQLSFMQDNIGFNMAINPDLETAKVIASMLNTPASVPSESFCHGKATLVEIEITSNSIFRDLTVADTAKFGIKFLICAVARENAVFIPNGSFVLKKGDRIHLIGSLTELVRLFRKMGVYTDKPHSVLIAGGSRIAAYLAKMLPNLNMGVKIIEKDETRCTELAESYPAVTVVRGDASDQSVMDSEGLSRMDAFVSLTNLDEGNLVLSMHAKRLKVDKVICKINHDAFLPLFKEIGIGNAVSPKEITANIILRYVRAMCNSFDDDSVKTLYRIVGGRVDAAEFTVQSTAAFADKQLKDIQCKSDVLIACIERKGKVMIPTGSDTVCVGDNVVVISKVHISDLEDIIL